MIHEPPVDWHHELASLKGEIDKLISTEPNNFVHTLQIVTSVSAKRSDPLSKTWSCEPDLVQFAVERFTGYSHSQRDEQFTQSLVGDDFEKAPYWYDVIGAVPSPIIQSPQGLDFRLERHGPWTYKFDGSVPQDDKLKAWRESLKATFSGRGATMWVTQSHRVRASEQLPTSSAFVLFNDDVPHAARYPIAKLLRDFLVAILGEMYREALGKSQELNVTLLQDILRDPGTTRTLGASILRQLKPLEKAIVSPAPMLITGESGTGKMGVALRIHGIRERYFSEADRPEARSAHRPYLINVSELEGTRQEVRNKIAKSIQTKSTAKPDAKYNEQGRGIVVFDNVHLARPQTQEVLRELIDDTFTHPTDRKKTWLPLRKPIFTSLPGLYVAASTGRFNSSLFAQISPFEVTCPPLRERKADLRDLVPGMVDTLSSALKLEKRFELNDEELTRIVEHSWPGNFRELQAYLIRRMLEAD